MNLNQNPTQDELKALIAAANDNDAHHILWADDKGEVRVSPLPDDINPAGWQDKYPSTVLRYETFQVGNDYVGPNAAHDESHLSRLYRSIVRQWADKKPGARGLYIDQF